jgi:lysophospholipase L1-like esterase
MAGEATEMDRRQWWASVGGIAVAASAIGGRAARARQEEKPKFESEIEAFEDLDERQPFPADPIVFVGSSTIRMWKLGKWFPGRPILNRGFGGSTLPDVLRYQGRVVSKYKPSVVVLYAGDNDIANGRPPEQVEEDFRAFAARLGTDNPGARLIWLGIKPSIKRWGLREEIREANRKVAGVVAGIDGAEALDFWERMLGNDGEPRAELYQDDGLHMSEEAYRMWSEALGARLGG